MRPGALRRLMRGPGSIAGGAGGIICLSALLALPAAAAAKPRPSPAPPTDTATASGDNLILDDFSSVDIEIDAHSGPSGENPGGTVFFVSGGILPISGPVTCLDVSGNTAVMTVAGPFPSAPQFASFIIRLVDNGGSGSDRFEYFTNNPEVPEVLDCRLGSEFYFGGPLIGRALVDDRDPLPPSPTSKKQCKRGGFVHFGFKNQGRCISHVLRHGRGGPAGKRHP